jgi:hypothetical protein
VKNKYENENICSPVFLEEKKSLDLQKLENHVAHFLIDFGLIIISKMFR